MKETIYVIIIFLFVFCCIETFCRIFKIEQTYTDERNIIYKYDEELGWSGKPNLNTSYIGIRVINNNLGFRDIEHNYIEKNKKRIMFIGDSFCWGYGVNQDKNFIELLRYKLKEYELFNCGISGYATDQEYILLKKYFDIIKPNIVLLVYCCANDNIENNTNFVFKQYYKPYYIIKNENLELHGIPVPKTWLYYKNNFFIKHSNFITFILKNFIIFKNPPIYTNDYGIIEDILLLFKQFLTDKNCTFYIGLTNSDDNFEKFLKSKDIKYIVLENKNTIENDIHWNEKGHEYVADKIYNFFKQENIIK